MDPRKIFLNYVVNLLCNIPLPRPNNWQEVNVHMYEWTGSSYTWEAEVWPCNTRLWVTIFQAVFFSSSDTGRGNEFSTSHNLCSGNVSWRTLTVLTVQMFLGISYTINWASQCFICRRDCETLMIKMAPISYPSLQPHPLQCELAAPSVKGRIQFPTSGIWAVLMTGFG